MNDERTTTEHELKLRSTRGFDGALVHVRVDEVLLPTGRHSVREVLEHPGAVAIVALTENDELILVKQWRYAVQEELLEIPAGTRDRDESPEETAIRELREETGYCAGNASELARFYTSAGYSTELLTIFLAEGCVEGEREPDVEEFVNVELIPRSALPGLVSGPNVRIKDAMSLVGILKLLREDSSD